VMALVAVAEEDASPLLRAGFSRVNGTRHAHEIPDFADPYAPDTYRFESPGAYRSGATDRPRDGRALALGSLLALPQSLCA
jgi:hypothetical protein